ncbi:ABC transporter B family member 2-like [Heracleum sosnowskyi]|uniref:ABC transporter B family member 2-like n=1 Tax=Heracleum sosnowskyi TaxID=360622 RepID=A0AAD8N7S7_9APIA|nr:ABC transporter B family member 2-like [Heracleum sosnowskyi]
MDIYLSIKSPPLAPFLSSSSCWCWRFGLPCSLYLAAFGVGFIIGFIRVWQISLVTLSIVPLIAIAGGVYAFVATGLIARVRKSYVSAGEIAQEVIGNVRTVQAFAGEEKAVKSYTSALQDTYKYGRRAGWHPSASRLDC